MNILHYSLGFPPYRTGGLTKYCTDLMLEQFKLGNNVALLWPGRIKIFNKKIKIKKNKSYNNINSYEIINPLPVPLLEGIKVPEKFMQSCDVSVYEDFLDEIKPDVIHIHTFMGLHKEFLEIANKKNIKIVYTSHDYFGLCPRVNLFNYKKYICDGINDEKCSVCCKDALEIKKIYLLQSNFYRKLKNSWFIKRLREKIKHKRIINNDSKVDSEMPLVNYNELKIYYKEMFKKVNDFYFNSEVAYNVFNNYIKFKEYQILPITHNDIRDRRIAREYNNNEILKIGYMGPENYAKGYNELIEVLDDLQKENMKFELNVYFKSNIKNSRYIKNNVSYNYDELQGILKNTDVIIVPSKWKETFGFLVLEAISYGVPVICSRNVGASYLIKNNDVGYIYDDVKELKEILKEICKSKDKLKIWNDNILKNDNICMNIEEHANVIINAYRK